MFASVSTIVTGNCESTASTHGELIGQAVKLRWIVYVPDIVAAVRGSDVFHLAVMVLLE